MCYIWLYWWKCRYEKKTYLNATHRCRYWFMYCRWFSFRICTFVSPWILYICIHYLNYMDAMYMCQKYTWCTLVCYKSILSIFTHLFIIKDLFHMNPFLLLLNAQPPEAIQLQLGKSLWMKAENRKNLHHGFRKNRIQSFPGYLM